MQRVMLDQLVEHICAMTPCYSCSRHQCRLLLHCLPSASSGPRPVPVASPSSGRLGIANSAESIAAFNTIYVLKHRYRLQLVDRCGRGCYMVTGLLSVMALLASHTSIARQSLPWGLHQRAIILTARSVEAGCGSPITMSLPCNHLS
jgi:hypothetical protein